MLNFNFLLFFLKKFNLFRDAKTAAITNVWNEVEARISSDKFANAFKQVPNIYTALQTILVVSYDNFQFVNSMQNEKRRNEEVKKRSNKERITVQVPLSQSLISLLRFKSPGGFVL